MTRLVSLTLCCLLLCSCGDDDDSSGNAGAGTSSTAGSGNTGGSAGNGGVSGGGSSSTAGTATAGGAGSGNTAGSGGGGPKPDALIEGKLAGASGYACAVDAQKKVICWGSGAQWDPGSPADADKVFVAVGSKSRCAIGSDGSVTCVGDLTNPTGSFKQVGVTNNNQGCGIGSDDTLKCWGTKGATWTLPPGKFKFLSAGADYVCAVSDAGAIACFGDGAAAMGQTPAGSFERVYVDELTGCGVGAGVLSCWGSDADDVPPSTAGAQVAIGDDFVCALESSGKITCFGKDSDVVGKEPAGTFSAIGAGPLTACAFSTLHQLVCWGPGSGTPPADFVAP